MREKYKLLILMQITEYKDEIFYIRNWGMHLYPEKW